MSRPAVLIATARLRPGQEEAFAAWQIRVNEVIAAFPGYLSNDVTAPKKPGDHTWRIALHFQSRELLLKWHQSPERSRLVDEILPLLESGKLEEALPETNYDQLDTEVTEVILSKIKPGMEAAYRAWAVKIQQAQAKYPGYRGMYLQPPESGKGHWTTLLRYDSQEHLDGWLNSPDRAELVREAQVFVEDLELTKLATSFPGWVPVDPATGESPPAWKGALLVLLGLFPIVMLEMRYAPALLDPLHLNRAVFTFICNFATVLLTGILTPIFARWFRWWLFPKGDAGATLKGGLLLSALYLIEILLCWRL